MSSGGVDAVIFDWGGTLTPWHTLDPADAWLAAAGDPGIASRLVAAERRAWQRCKDEQCSATLAAVCADAGVAATEDMLAAFHAWWEPHTYLDPDAPATFAALRERGIAVGVLSNTIWPGVVHDAIFKRDGVLGLIDGAVYTSEIAWTKPHPEAFRAAMHAVGVTDASRTVFVGDRTYDDIHGAKAVGMRAVLVPHSTIPDEQRGPVDGEPDAVIERLADLVPAIERWS